MTLKVFYLALLATTYALPDFDPLLKRADDDPCVPCRPQGATGTTPPAIGPGLSSLYTNILGSVKGIQFQARSLVERESGFCCRKSLNCVNVQNLNIAMCYDKFTTNFAFADGSYGSLTTGQYTSGANNANLLTGDFTSNGQQGNIYASAPADKPNTSTLSIPPQYTGTGVGSAIPANELGSIIVYTTTIPGETYTAPTTVPQTVQVNTVNGQSFTTTIPAKTISQATTIAPVTSVATVTQKASSTSSKGAAAQVTVDGTRGFGMSILGFLLYAIM